MIKSNFFLIALIITLNSCTTAYFVKKTQQVSIVKDSTVSILINDSIPLMSNNNYLFKRDGEAKIITLKKEGYKSTTKIINPYILSPNYYATIGINAAFGGIGLATIIKNSETEAPPLLFGILGSAIGGVWGFGVANFSSELINYDEQLDLSKVNLVKLPVKDSLMKAVKLNTVNIDIKRENYRNTIFTNNQYYNGEKGDSIESKRLKPFVVKNTYFSDLLNSKLKEFGFIDTTGYALNSGYTQNVFINATITGCNINLISNNIRSPLYFLSKFINIELAIKWDFLDYYKNVIFSDTINTKSGDFIQPENLFSQIPVANQSDENEYMYKALNEAVESSLYTFMTKPEFCDRLRLEHKDSIEKHSQLTIKRVTRFVNSIEEAADATVTVKTKDGHGSGMFISEDGYIVTNYHVVSNPEKLEIITSDGSKYAGKVIRSNKVSDFALLKIEKINIIPFNITDVPAVSIGNDIYAIGTPSAEDLAQTMSRGIISSIRTHTNGIKTIQFDASVNQGNSGGSLINKDGKLIGVVKSKILGIGVEGISFALHAKDITKSLSIVFE